MLKTLPLALGLALLAAAPAAAQKMGSVNRNAPTCTQAIKFANGAEVQLSYVAITWADGKTLAAAADPQRGEATRNRINSTAEAQPLGSVKTTTDLTMSGRTIPAGEYDLYFTVMENQGNLMWLANLRQKGNKEAEPIRWSLALEDSEMEMHRLVISLHAGEGDNNAGVYLAFGKKYVMVNLSCAEKAGE